MSPEILHLIFTGAGVALGWYLKHQSIRTPPELLAFLEQHLSGLKQRRAVGLLQELLNESKAASGTTAAPAADPPGKG